MNYLSSLLFAIVSAFSVNAQNKSKISTSNSFTVQYYYKLAELMQSAYKTCFIFVSSYFPILSTLISSTAHTATDMANNARNFISNNLKPTSHAE